MRDSLRADGIRAELDSRSEKMGFKIREAELEKVPYILVVGDREMQQNAVAVRERGGKDSGVIELAQFITTVKNKISEKKV